MSVSLLLSHFLSFSISETSASSADCHIVLACLLVYERKVSNVPREVRLVVSMCFRPQQDCVHVLEELHRASTCWLRWISPAGIHQTEHCPFWALLFWFCLYLSFTSSVGVASYLSFNPTCFPSALQLTDSMGHNSLIRSHEHRGRTCRNVDSDPAAVQSDCLQLLFSRLTCNTSNMSNIDCSTEAWCLHAYCCIWLKSVSSQPFHCSIPSLARMWQRSEFILVPAACPVHEHEHAEIVLVQDT